MWLKQEALTFTRQGSLITLFGEGEIGQWISYVKSRYAGHEVFIDKKGGSLVMRKGNTKCLVGFLLALLLGSIPLVPIIALVISIKGRKECLPTTKNRWMGVAGIVLSIIEIIVHVLAIVVFVVVLVNINHTMSIEENSSVKPDAVYDTQESNPEMVTEEETEEVTEEVVEDESEKTTQDVAVLFADDQPNTKRSTETLPEIGEYEVYGYWGGYRGETYNGY